MTGLQVHSLGWSLGFMEEGRKRDEGSELRVSRVKGSTGMRVQGLGFGVKGSGFWLLGSGFRVSSLGFRV